MVRCNDRHGPSLCCMQYVEYTRPPVRSGRLRLMRRGISWRNLPKAHLQRVTAASSQPSPAESMRLDSRTLGAALSFPSTTVTSFTALPSIGCAIPRHRSSLKSMPERHGPLCRYISCVSQYDKLTERRLRFFSTTPCDFDKILLFCLIRAHLFFLFFSFFFVNDIH